MKKASKVNNLIVAEPLEPIIRSIRGQKTILDSDLARIYGVETKMLNRAVKRNVERFPGDFAFRLTRTEFENLRRQIGTSRSYGGRRYLPYAFTEHGAVMAANVLNSERAVAMSVYVVRAFVKLREGSQATPNSQRSSKNWSASSPLGRTFMRKQSSNSSGRSRIC